MKRSPAQAPVRRFVALCANPVAGHALVVAPRAFLPHPVAGRSPCGAVRIVQLRVDANLKTSLIRN